MIISKFQYISQGATAKAHIDHITMACEAGCKWIQLRLKNMSEKLLRDTAYAVQELCRQYKATLIINDHVRIAKQLNADGVHLGDGDMDSTQARSFLGKSFIIGGTANTTEDCIRLHRQKVDYIGLGPFRFTTTKKKLKPLLGITGYQDTLRQLQQLKIQTPVIAIGGITAEDITPILKTGVHGIAISGLLTYVKDKKQLLEEINSRLE